MDKVYNTIREYGLIQQGDKIVIGLSGGADSMCLTHVLHSLRDRLGITLLAAHMNHNIRGADADSDARAARQFAQSLGIPFVLKSENVIQYAKEKGISEELAGRELRYAFFYELLEKNGLTKIATAHNKNDNAETLIMNFMRGSSLKGLCGIPHMRSGIIRPLLEVTRSEIEKYCREHKLPYVTDKTNNERIYTRNKIRLELIPEICREFNPNFINTVTDNSRLISADSEFIENAADKFYNENVTDGKIGIKALLSAPKALSGRTVMRMLAEKCGGAADLSSGFADDIIRLAEKGESGKSINLPKGVSAYIEYDKLCIGVKKNIPEFEYTIPLDREIYIKEMNKTVYAEYVTEKCGDGIYITADKSDTVIIRNRREGDVFYPQGMNGRKKIKDYFIDLKIPRDERTVTGIVTVNGEIACIIAKRYDKRFVFKEKGIKITLK